MMQAVTWYHKQGYSIIPINTPKKKPFIKWAEFQDRQPTEEEIAKWWTKWPDAGVGIVTGELSGITIIDIDNKEGEAAFEEYVSDSFLTPTAKSPHGRHYYFAHCPGLPNKARVLEGCDIRNDGGYIIAPPSKNGKGGGYHWLPDCKIGKIALAEIPSKLKQDIISPSSLTSYINSKDHTMTTVDTELTEVDIIQKGGRDEALFHLANHLVKGRMPLPNIRKYLHFFASKCDPPFPPKEVETKVQSALNRSKNNERNLAQEIRDFVESTSGVFSATDCRHELTIVDTKEIKYISKVMGRLIKEGLIERYGNKNGQFRRIETESLDIDIFSAQTETLPIKYPLDIDSMFITMPKNIIVVAGTQDAGKTAFLLRTTQMNMNRGMEIRYMTSEMGGAELVSRLKLFRDTPLSDWKNVNFKECAMNFQDYILPDAINIIDFLEITDSFWLVGDLIRKVFDKLNNGICILAIQKDFKSELGRGGSFGLEKPRLYLTMTSNPPAGGLAKIVKCKNWKSSNFNPNGRECSFKIRGGSDIGQLTDWEYPMRKETKHAKT